MFLLSLTASQATTFWNPARTSSRGRIPGDAASGWIGAPTPEEANMQSAPDMAAASSKRGRFHSPSVSRGTRQISDLPLRLMRRYQDSHHEMMISSAAGHSQQGEKPP